MKKDLLRRGSLVGCGEPPALAPSSLVMKTPEPGITARLAPFQLRINAVLGLGN
jgi:hypothetical protein